MLALVLATMAVLEAVFACGGEMATAPPPPAEAAAAPAAPPPPPRPAEPSGCSKDMDCKGNRLCEHGSCVAPGN